MTSIVNVDLQNYRENPRSCEENKRLQAMEIFSNKHLKALRKYRCSNSQFFSLPQIFLFFLYFIN